MKRLIPRPEGVDAKIQRAKRHLAVIKREVRAYQASHPEFVDAKLDQNLPGYVLNANTRPPNIGLSVKVGDFLFNLRSALDHLARGLVLTEGNTPADTGGSRTSFPILEKKPKKLDIAGGVDPTALNVVEKLQPYHQPAGGYWASELWILNELNNIDKHRNLHFPTATWFSPTAGVVITESQPPFRHWMLVSIGRIDSGDKLGRIVVQSPTPHPKVEMRGKYIVNVLMPTFGPNPSAGLPLVDGMQALLEFVRIKVVPSFDKYFQ
jgi:hypothetical protein